jgi:hypothetical protein
LPPVGGQHRGMCQGFAQRVRRIGCGLRVMRPASRRGSRRCGQRRRSR